VKVQKVKIVFALLGVITLIGLLSINGIPSAEAGPIPHLKSGMFGMVRGQSARVSILNTQTEGGVIAIIRILAGDGTVLQESPEMLIAMDQSAFFDVNGDTLPYIEQRFQLRVEVILNDANLRKGRSRGNLMTIEVYENATGKTSFIINPNSIWDPGL
jgi:hypothetical protein